MQTFKHLKDQLHIDFDTKEMTEVQVRLLKTVNVLLTNIMTTSEEADYFENTAELMKTIASVVKKSHFASDHNESIAYAEQAIEFAVDSLSDEINSEKYVRYDN
ncbi:MAG: hypothetical protein ACI9QD_000534 [Thermoproteota archaeon]|jgi:hypothetical protein